MKRALVLMLGLLIAVRALPAAAQEPIWTAEFFDNPSFSGDPITVQAASIDFNWGTDSPLIEISPDQFSVRMTAEVYLDEGVYRFFARADDFVRVTLVGQEQVTLIDTSDAEIVGRLTAADYRISAGLYSVVVEYVELQDIAFLYVNWTNRGMSIPNLGDATGTPEALGPWQAAYYANPDLAGEPFAVIQQNNITRNWGSDAPLPGLPADNFSARFTTTHTLEEGEYDLRVFVDDGVRVYIDNVPILDEWHPAPGETYLLRLRLPGGATQFTVEYYENTVFAYIDWALTRVIESSDVTPTPHPTSTPPPTTAPTNTPLAIVTSTAQPTTTASLPSAPTVVPAIPAPVVTEPPLEVNDVIDNLDGYVGRAVRVEGDVGAAVGQDAYILNSNDLLTDSSLLVLKAGGDPAFYQLADTEVVVTGYLELIDIPTLEARYGLDLDDGVFAGFAGFPVLVAYSATNLFDVSTIEIITEDPEAFYGREVVVEGVVSDAVGLYAFLLEDVDFIDLQPEALLVIDTTGTPLDFTLLWNEYVIISGTIRYLVSQDIEEQYGIVLEESLYAEFEGRPVLIADIVAVR